MQRFDQLFDAIAPPALLADHGTTALTGVCDDSRAVTPDSVFVAVRGSRSDGLEYVPQAVAAGARVVVTERPVDVAAAINVVVPDTRLTLATLAWRWFELPRRLQSVQLLGVTGTNGKTTTAFMTQALLQATGLRCALFGTIHYDTLRRTIPAPLTTPGSLQLAAYLDEALTAGADAIMMEVSSHALDQRRTAGLPFTAAAFTNLTQDHLDYHQTFEAYRDAKALLFRDLAPAATAVINIDDPASHHLQAATAARVVTFGRAEAATLRAELHAATLAGTRFDLVTPSERHAATLPLIGTHNVYNALAAVGLAQAIGLEPARSAALLAQARGVPGRLEAVATALPATVFVDYAHTPDALENVLQVLRPLTAGRLHVVFGCGGDRDRGKRPLMAAAVGCYADRVVLTSDNPRTENPHQIIADTLPGFTTDQQQRVTVEPDRRVAIRAALSAAAAPDVVLVAGKGHEDYQVIGTERRPFDDRAVAQAEAQALAAAPASTSTQEAAP